MRTFNKTIFSTILLMAASSVALAQTPVTSDETPQTPPAGTDSGTGTPGKTAAPTEPGETLPESQSDHDVQPPVASPGAAAAGGIVSQAGVGGLIGYGRAGVLELGGSAGFTFASDYRNLNIAPSIGWFVADNLELSAILSISNIKAGGSSTTLWSAILEPSYHVPFNRSMFAFAGMGLGASHVSGLGTGFAVAPRVGMNFMVGRSGVLTPSLSYQYTTINTDTESMTGDVTVVALTSALQVNMGYTAMW